MVSRQPPEIDPEPALPPGRHGALDSPLGPLVLSWRGTHLLSLRLSGERDAKDAPRGGAACIPLRDRVKCRGEASDGFDAIPPAILAALADYFRNPKAGLPVAVAPAGTPFQLRVWRALQAIPVGETRRYGDLARDLNTSARAIGGACRANPCLIAIPCHRVVAKVGLGGFGGDVEGRLLAVKRWLLRHEGCIYV